MPSIDVFDFSGGRNTRDGQALVQLNQCVASSRGVWASGGALAKLPGFDTIASFQATTTGFRSNLKTLANLSPVYSYIYTQLATATGDSRFFFSGGALNPVGLSLTGSYVALSDGLPGSPLGYHLGYSTGSVSVIATAVSENFTATGSGTLWANHITTGDIFEASGNAVGRAVGGSVEEVVDNTHIVFKSATGLIYPSTATGTSNYEIMKKFKYEWPLSMQVLGSALYISDGSGTALVKFDGTGETTVSASTTPVPRFLVTHKQRMFGFRMDKTGQKDRLVWSDLEVSGASGADNWPVVNFIDIAKGVKGNGNGLFAVGNEILCFKEKGIYKVIGNTFDPFNPDFSVIEILVPKDFGFHQPYSITEHKGNIVFKADYGWYQYIPGTVFITKISELINGDRVATEVSKNDIPFPQKFHNYAFSSSYKDRLFTSALFVDTTGNINDSESYIMDERNAWWKYVNNTASGGNIMGNLLSILPLRTVSVTGNIGFSLFGIYPASNNLLQIDSTATNVIGTKAIDSEWISKEFNIGYGKFKELVIYFKKQTGTLTVGWQVDQGTKVTEAVNMSIGRGTIVRRTININQKGSTIQIYLSNYLLNEVFEIYGFNINYDTDPVSRIP